MARIASQAKAGFYPTPDTVCELLKTKINFEEGITRLLDPCCGKGKTLSRLADGVPNLTTYGIELDHQRANEARSRLTKVSWCDALTEMQVSPNAFGLLYLNPPYDHDVSDGTGAQRLEVLFLRRYLGTLQVGGYLVLVIPYYILKHCAKPLARYFRDVQVCAFPEADFSAFKQCIVFARKERLVAKEEAAEVQTYLTTLSHMTPELFTETADLLDHAETITVPAAAKGSLRTFRAKRTDPLEAIPLVRKAGILKGVLYELIPRKNNVIRPLTPLENGHLALMLAGGYMNGAVEKDGRQLVIKGMVTKNEEVISGGENSDRVVTKDKYVPTVKVIDMQTAELIMVQ